MALETASPMSQTPELTAFRAIFVVRQRFAEEELAKAVARGVRQYVILGAGLDSLAYRRPDLTGMLQIFEVDHPSTQQWKRQRLTERGIAIPDNLTFVPLDFEVQDLAETMASSPFQSAEPAFFSWLGVTQYLSEGRGLQDVAMGRFIHVRRQRNRLSDRSSPVHSERRRPGRDCRGISACWPERGAVAEFFRARSTRDAAARHGICRCPSPDNGRSLDPVSSGTNRRALAPECF